MLGEGDGSGFDQQTAGRYTVVPRTLVFLEDDDHVLLLRGAEHKWFAGMYNGIGGHVEADEDVYTAAAREVAEETGLTPEHLELAGIVHVLGERPGVILFVFCAHASGTPHSTDEGVLSWVPVNEIAEYPLVPDLTWLLPRVLRRPSTPIFATLHVSADRLTIETAEGERTTIDR